VAGSREGVARSPACEERCGAVCGAEVQDTLGIPRDPRRDGEDPRSRVRRSKPDAISRMLALGVVENQKVLRSMAVPFLAQS